MMTFHCLRSTWLRLMTSDSVIIKVNYGKIYTTPENPKIAMVYLQ